MSVGRGRRARRIPRGERGKIVFLVPKFPCCLSSSARQGCAGTGTDATRIRGQESELLRALACGRRGGEQVRLMLVQVWYSSK